MSRLAVFLLGSFQVTLDGLPLTSFATDKVRALLAYLAVESKIPQRREALAAMLWPDRPERAARNNLRQALYRLRRALGDDQATFPHLLVTAKDVQLDPGNSHWLDVTEFEAHISAGRARPPRSLELCPDCLARLEAAVELYQGDFLAGFTLPACSRFEWWQFNVQETCHRHVLEALHQLVVAYEAQGDYAAVRRYARREIELEPWRESAHRRCMRACVLCGRRGEALHQYEVCRALLFREMGVKPSAETTKLYEQIRSGALPGIAAGSEAGRSSRPSLAGAPAVMPGAARVPSPPVPL